MIGIANLLDTNFVIGLMNEKPEATDIKADLGLSITNIAVSQISRIELLSYWAITASEELWLREFFNSCPVLAIDPAIEQAAIDLRRRTRLKLPDAIIGATALVHGLHLITLDARLEAALKPVAP